MCIHMHTCKYIYTPCTYVHLCSHTYTPMHTHITCIQIHACTHIHAYTCTPLHTRTCFILRMSISSLLNLFFVCVFSLLTLFVNPPPPPAPFPVSGLPWMVTGSFLCIMAVFSRVPQLSLQLTKSPFSGWPWGPPSTDQLSSWEPAHALKPKQSSLPSVYFPPQCQWRVSSCNENPKEL